MDEGMNHLARVISQRAHDAQQAGSSLVLDFGTIGADHSLTTNTYPIAIPPSDYLVLSYLLCGDTGDNFADTTNSGTHKHEVILPAPLRSPRPGDSVLVAWVQHDAVVLGLISSAENLK